MGVSTVEGKLMLARSRTKVGAVALATVVGTLGSAAVAAPAFAGAEHRAPKVSVLARHLEGPFGIEAVGRHGFVVAENGSGQITAIGDHGRKHALVTGVAGVAGVATDRHHVYGVLGGPNEDGAPPAGTYAPSTVLRSDWSGHHVKVIADLGRYELRHNPDGQVQFADDGTPYDALSNPFSMTMSRYGLLVADGGANDVLRVNPRTGRVSTFFVPHTVTDVEACLAPEAQANPGTVGCDPVPTGVAVHRGSVYVSTLGAEVPGAGRVYKLNERTGRVQHVWKGLDAPTGVAVAPNGAIYVSEVLYGAPAGDPPADFDPSTVGRITKIWHGRQTHAQVTMPTGLDYERGHLYATAWSIAGMLGIAQAGQVVQVNPRAFR
jgi:glucose/arabinose dehydrogenase